MGRSHLANLCQNLSTLRWKSVIAGLSLVRPQVFHFGKNFANRQNIKDAVVLGWSRQISENSGLTIAITAVTVIACQYTANRKYAIKLRAHDIDISASVCALSLPWTDVDFIITILPVYFSSNAEYSPYVYSAQGQSCGPEEATTGILELLRALGRILLYDPSSSPKLSRPSSSSSSAEERRVYACRMLLRLWAENFCLIECHH